MRCDMVYGLPDFQLESGGVFREAADQEGSATDGPGSMKSSVDYKHREAICCTLQEKTSSAFQQLFGDIQATHLLGVASQQLEGASIKVNNPLFRCHIYARTPTTGKIYNSGGGPHVGSQDVMQPLASAADTQTTAHTYPAVVNNVTGSSSAINTAGVNDGTTMLSGMPFPTHCLQFLTELVPGLGQVNPAQRVVKHVDWANVRRWLKAVLGDTWAVDSGEVLAMEGTTFALWSLVNSAGANELIEVRVVVKSCAAASNGSFDLAASVEAIQNSVAVNVLDGCRDPRDIWARGDFDDMGDYSLQYSDAAEDSSGPGCVVVVAANGFVEIKSYGMTNAALRNVTRKLLEHTVRRNGEPPLALPLVTRAAPTSVVGEQDAIGDASTSVIHVKGVCTCFTVSFSVESEICAVGATCEVYALYGISFNGSLIHSKEPARGHLVDLEFLTRELGRHRVRVHFSDALTLLCVSKDLEVDVTMW